MTSPCTTRRGARGRAAARRQHGFTLIEVVIALVLISLLMLLLTAAMRSMGQTETAIEERVAQTEDYRTTVLFLRDVLSEASARPLAASTQANAPRVFFAGGPQELSWIGVLPARYGMGGRHYMHLGLENGALVLRFAPWNGAATYDNWSAAERRVLAPDVSVLKLSYQDARNGQWVDSWPPVNVPRAFAVPAVVQIEMDNSAFAWPALAVPVSGMLASDPNMTGGVTFGGRNAE